MYRILLSLLAMAIPAFSGRVTLVSECWNGYTSAHCTETRTLGPWTEGSPPIFTIQANAESLFSGDIHEPGTFLDKQVFVVDTFVTAGPPRPGYIELTYSMWVNPGGPAHIVATYLYWFSCYSGACEATVFIPITVGGELRISIGARSLSRHLGTPDFPGEFYYSESTASYTAQIHEGSIDGPLVAMTPLEVFVGLPEPSAQGPLGLLLFGLAAVLRGQWRRQASKQEMGRV